MSTCSEAVRASVKAASVLLPPLLHVAVKPASSKNKHLEHMWSIYSVSQKVDHRVFVDASFRSYWPGPF